MKKLWKAFLAMFVKNVNGYDKLKKDVRSVQESHYKNMKPANFQSYVVPVNLMNRIKIMILHRFRIYHALIQIEIIKIQMLGTLVNKNCLKNSFISFALYIFLKFTRAIYQRSNHTRVLHGMERNMNIQHRNERCLKYTMAVVLIIIYKYKRRRTYDIVSFMNFFITLTVALK